MPPGMVRFTGFTGKDQRRDCTMIPPVQKNWHPKWIKIHALLVELPDMAELYRDFEARRRGQNKTPLLDDGPLWGMYMVGGYLRMMDFIYATEECPRAMYPFSATVFNIGQQNFDLMLFNVRVAQHMLLTGKISLATAKVAFNKTEEKQTKPFRDAVAAAIKFAKESVKWCLKRRDKGRMVRQLDVRNENVKKYNMTSGHAGVGFVDSNAKWRAECYDPATKKKKYLGTHLTEDGAARAIDVYIIDNALPHKALHFPDFDDATKAYAAKYATSAGASSRSSTKKVRTTAKRSDRRRSKYPNVSWDKRNKKWNVRVWKDETHKQVGTSANEKEAAEIYDDYCDDHDLGWPLNFPSRLGLYTAKPFPNKHNPKKRKAASGETTTKPGKKKRSRK